MLNRQEVERRYGQVYSKSGNEYKVECVSCGTKAMWVNVRKQAYYCFSCGYKGKYKEHVIPGSAYNKVDPETREIKSVFPPGFIWFNEEQIPEVIDHYRYVKGRGIDPLSLAWGIAGDYCIFPLWKDGQVVYWQGRAIQPIKPKTKNPSKEVSGFGKSDLLYNYENEHGVIARKYVILVEGVFDALTADGVAMLGKIISPKQADLIANLLPKKVFQVLDADADQDAFNENRETLRRSMPFVPIFDVHLPEGDPNSLGQAAVWSLLTRSGVLTERR